MSLLSVTLLYLNASSWWSSYMRLHSALVTHCTETPIGDFYTRWAYSSCVVFFIVVLMARTKHFKCIFLNEIECIVIHISLNFVRRGSIDNNSSLVQVMPWIRAVDKPLPEPMVTHADPWFDLSSLGHNELHIGNQMVEPEVKQIPVCILLFLTRPAVNIAVNKIDI